MSAAAPPADTSAASSPRTIPVHPSTSHNPPPSTSSPSPAGAPTTSSSTTAAAPASASAPTTTSPLPPSNPAPSASPAAPAPAPAPAPVPPPTASLPLTRSKNTPEPLAGYVGPSSFFRRPPSGSRQNSAGGGGEGGPGVGGSGGDGTAGGLRSPGGVGLGRSLLGEGLGVSALDREQIDGLKAIRAFLKARTSYDVLPLSFRLIVFDTALLVKKSLNILIQNGIVSAPLWDSRTSTFAGLLTASDYINVVQYYWQNPDALAQIDQFRLDSLPKVEQALGVAPIETVSIHPSRPVYEACRKMLSSRARRIPLVDVDDETQRAMVVSVVTQYRILKFVAVNVRETQMLRKPLKELRTLGTYRGLATATLDTPVMDVIHMLVRKGISSVPILDAEGFVINVFEAVDVITLIKGGMYDDLNLSVGEALLKRSDDFPGIYTCSLHDRLDAIFDTIRKSRVHRFVILGDTGKLEGVLTLSDILDYVLLEGETDP